MIYRQLDFVKIQFPGISVIQYAECTLDRFVLKEWTLGLIKCQRVNEAVQVQIDSQNGTIRFSLDITSQFMNMETKKLMFNALVNRKPGIADWRIG